MLEIRHLRYAIAVAEEGHMTRAAERLGLQQPPLSQQIKALEALVGSPLFRRLPRGMEMTDAGRAFVDRARQVLADLDATVDAARRAARGETGALAVGFTSSAAFHPLVSSVFRGLRQALPDLALRLEEGATDELTSDLLAGRLDAAFIRSASETQSSLVIDHVDTEEMLLAIPDVHPLAHPSQKMRRIELADLCEDVFILYRRPSGQGLYDRIIAACQRAGFSPRIAQEAPKMVSTLSLVAAGLGASIIPESMARLETSGVVYRRFTQSSGLVAPLYLALRRDGQAGALARFVEEVSRNVKNPGSARQGPTSG